MSSPTSYNIARSTLWSAVDKFGIVILQFVINLVLARMLTPDDFGLVGMIMVVVAVSSILADGGFGAALIQKSDADEEDFSTTFYINIVVATLLYGLIYLSSPYIAIFLGNPIFEQLLRVLSVVIVINSLGVTPKAKLRRDMAFKHIAIANIIAYVIAAAVAIAMAAAGYGLWGLIAIHIVNSLLSNLLLSVFAKWRPSLTFSMRSLKRLFGYGQYILISDILSNLCFHIQSTLVGKYFAPSIAGQYSQAKKMEEVACITLPSAMNQVLFPLYSKLQNDMESLRKKLRINTKTIAFIIFPLLTLLMIIAEPLINFLFGEKWLDAVPYFQVLCIGGYFCALQYLNYYAIAATGRSKVLFYAGVFKSLFLILSVLLAVHISMGAVLAAMVLSNIVNYLTNAALAAHYLGYKLSRQIGDVLGILIKSLIVGLIVVSTMQLCHFNWLIVAIIYGFLYLLINVATRDEIATMLMAKLRGGRILGNK